jgi:hypothetical protein
MFDVQVRSDSEIVRPNRAFRRSSAGIPLPMECWANYDEKHGIISRQAVCQDEIASGSEMKTTWVALRTKWAAAAEQCSA